MRVIPPLAITDARLTSSSVPEVAPAAYAAGTTYALATRVGVLGLKGLIDVYESLQAGNLGNTPASSPTWWKFVGSTYGVYSTALTYNFGDKVIDSVTHEAYESLTSGNKNRSLTNVPTWFLAISDNSFPASLRLASEPYLAGTTYAIDAIAVVQFAYVAGGISLMFYRSLAAGNLNNPPATSPAQWSPIGNDYFYYSSIETYPVGGRVSDSNNRSAIYESTIANNLGNPLISVTTLSWFPLGKTNRWGMFDLLTSQRTVVPSPLVVTLAPAKRIDSIDLSGMVNVKTARIQITSSGSSVYDQTVNLQKRNVSSWYTHFFAPFMFKKSAVKFDLTPYSNSIITVTLTSASGNIEVGSLIIGSQFYIGATQYNAVSDYVNYSTVQREFDGSIAKLLQRPGIPKTSQTVWLEKDNVQAFKEFLQSVDATPIAVSGIDDAGDGYFEPIHVVGFIKSAPIDIAHPNHAVCNMSIEAISSN